MKSLSIQMLVAKSGMLSEEDHCVNSREQGDYCTRLHLSVGKGSSQRSQHASLAGSNEFVTACGWIGPYSKVLRKRRDNDIDIAIASPWSVPLDSINIKVRRQLVEYGTSSTAVFSMLANPTTFLSKYTGPHPFIFPPQRPLLSSSLYPHKSINRTTFNSSLHSTHSLIVGTTHSGFPLLFGLAPLLTLFASGL